MAGNTGKREEEISEIVLRFLERYRIVDQRSLGARGRLFLLEPTAGPPWPRRRPSGGSDTIPRSSSPEDQVRPVSHAETTPRQHRRPSAQALLRSLFRPSRFAVVGVIGLGVNVAAFVFFHEVVGMHYALAAIVASQVSTLNNFILTELWVFRARTRAATSSSVTSPSMP